LEEALFMSLLIPAAGITAKVEAYPMIPARISREEMQLTTSKYTAMLIGLLTLLSLSSAAGCLSEHHAQALPQASGEGSVSTLTAPANWHKVDAGPFAILAPPGWEFHQLQGVDSYVGEFVGENIVLRFDFGGDSNPLKEEKKPAYVVTHKSIGGRRAKVVSPRTPGHGITGVYISNVGDSNALTLFGRDLTSAQQELVLKIFETLRFGGPLPRYLNPPPTKNVQ
jgi:hypothetical protein